MRVEISSNFAVSMWPKGVAFGEAGSTRLDSLKKSFRPYLCQSIFTEPHTQVNFKKWMLNAVDCCLKLSGSLGIVFRTLLGGWRYGSGLTGLQHVAAIWLSAHQSSCPNRSSWCDSPTESNCPFSNALPCNVAIAPPVSKSMIRNFRHPDHGHPAPLFFFHQYLVGSELRFVRGLFIHHRGRAVGKVPQMFAHFHGHKVICPGVQ